MPNIQDPTADDPVVWPPRETARYFPPPPVGWLIAVAALVAAFAVWVWPW